MDRKQLATIAVICGAVAFVAVLLPWYSVSTPMGGHSANGTEGEFNGVFVIVLSLLAGVAALLVVLGRTDLLPLDERQHVFASLVLFALAAVVTLLDVFSDLPSASSGMGIEMGKSFGMYLTLLATLGGTVVTFLAVMKPPAPTASDDG